MPKITPIKKKVQGTISKTAYQELQALLDKLGDTESSFVGEATIMRMQQLKYGAAPNLDKRIILSHFFETLEGYDNSTPSTVLV